MITQLNPQQERLASDGSIRDPWRSRRRRAATVVPDSMRRLLVLAATVAIASAAATRHGAGTSRAADAEFGRYLASECLTCHRTGTATSTIPNIFGMAESTFGIVMRAYRGRELPNPVMQNIASRLTDEEIAALALYFSETKQP